MGILDPEDVLDLSALHAVYLPLIQSQLNIFREGWCNHPLRTEHNRTPHQLWIMGMELAQVDDPTSTAVQGVSSIGTQVSTMLYL